MRRGFLIGAGACLVAVLYWPVLSRGHYVFDDHWFIERNPALATFTPLNYFLDPTTAAASASGLAQDVYRPLTTLVFAAERMLGFGPRGAHITQLILHALNALMVWLILRQRIQTAPIALGAAFVFLFHPLQVQSVAWLSQLSTVLCGFWVLQMLWWLDSRRLSVGRAGLGFIAFAAALCSKESAVVAPLLWWLLPESPENAVPSQNSACRQRLLATLVLMAAVFWGIRGQLLGHFSQRPDMSSTFTENICLGVLALATYLGKMVWPLALRASYDWPAWQPVHITLQLALAIAVVLGMVYLWRQRHALGWAGLWTVAGLIPVMQWVPLRAYVIERAVYLPIIGFGVFLGWWWQHRARTRGVLSLWALAMLWLTGQAVPAWTSDVLLWRQAVRSEPGNAFARSCLAESLGASPEAMAQYRRALVSNPSAEMAYAIWNNMAALALHEGRPGAAMYFAAEAIRINPKEMAAKQIEVEAQKRRQDSKRTSASSRQRL